MRSTLDCDNLTLISDQCVDFYIHISAHLKIDNPAGLFDEIYVGQTAQIKGQPVLQLAQELSRVTLDNYIYLSFLPPYFSSTENFLDAISVLAGVTNPSDTALNELEKNFIAYIGQFFTPDDLPKVAGLNAVMIREFDTFYQNYWAEQREEFTQRLNYFRDFWLTENNAAIRSFLQKNGIGKIDLFLSPAMLKNGRAAAPQNLAPMVISKLPANRDEAFYSAQIALHEMLHFIVDPLTIAVYQIKLEERTLDQENDGFQIHLQLEKSVVYTHYQLLKKYYPADLTEFFGADCNQTVIPAFCADLLPEMIEKIQTLID